jgi:hypothetical protein
MQQEVAMVVCPDAVQVRSIVRRIFAELGIDRLALEDLSETILIDEGTVRARSYRIENLMAMWLMDVGIVQFYDDEGNMLRRANLLSEAAPRRMAA